MPVQFWAFVQPSEECEMGMLWMGGLLRGGSDRSEEVAAMRDQAQSQKQRMQELEHHVARLSLLNQALWELVHERLGLSDADLEAKATEVDARDGVKDGVVTHGPLQCPKCGRVSNSRHWKCLYCGLEFEKPVME